MEEAGDTGLPDETDPANIAAFAAILMLIRPFLEDAGRAAPTSMFSLMCGLHGKCLLAILLQTQ